ncbi:MAG: hypothetical protein QOK06_806 [Acidimicrobiaceae bacterium]
MLRDLFVALLVASAVFVAMFVAALFYARHRLKRQLRLRPSTPSKAPTSWLVSTGESARLHRRLRRATAAARAMPGAGSSTLAPLVTEIEEHAIVLEAHLVAAYRLKGRGRSTRRAVAAQVKELEAVVARLVKSSLSAPTVAALPGAPADRLAEVTERLDALEAARAELDAIEVRAGLRSTL